MSRDLDMDATGTRAAKFDTGDGRVVVELLDGFGSKRVGIHIYREGRVIALSKRQAEELYDGLRKLVDP